MNPLWVDARDYLTSQGQPISTHGLNAAMNLLASNPQLRPSAVKAGGGANGIAAGLGAPTDQIIQTPLAPPGITETPLPPPAAQGGSAPSPPQSVGRGKQGASSGKKTAGGTSASGKTVKDVPAGVGHANDSAQTPMGGYTPPAPPNAPGAPVGMAQAGTGGDGSDFLSGGRLAALGGAGAAILAALLMGRGGREGGLRPGSSREGEVIPPDRMTVYGQGSAEGPIINGDPIQQLLGGSDRTDYGAMHGGHSYGPEDYGASTGRDPDSGPQVAGPQSFEDMIAQLAAQAPRGGALPPPGARPPIQMPNQTSGPPIAMPPTGGQQLMDLLRGLGG